MKTLVVGCRGQLGSDMMRIGAELGFDVSGVDLPEIDLTNAEGVSEVIRRVRPETMINCSAYTAVDDCESKADLAFAINRDGVGALARAAAACNARLVHFSTDYVFDGRSEAPYVESDAARPETVYGKSKLAGERVLCELWPRHLVLRLAWLYGINGANFVKTMIRSARRAASGGPALRVVDDQWGSPTWAEDVCRQTYRLLDTDATGVFHCTSEGRCTWCTFARRIVELARIPATVTPCTTAEFPRPARRPAFSVLENQALKRLGVNIMPDWEAAIEEFFGLYAPRLLAQEDPR